MLNGFRVPSSAGGFGFIPAKPTMSYNTTAKFNVTNFSAANNYILVPNSGTASIDGSGVVTLTSSNVDCTVAARGPKGLTDTATSFIGRRPYTFTFACTAQCADAFFTPEQGFVWILQPFPCNCGPQLNPAPSGYSPGTGEWQRIVN